MSKSKKPSGLKITRKGNKFICEWKIPSEKYGDGQQFRANTVPTTDIGKTDTKKTVVINLSDRYPAGHKLESFSFSVRGDTHLEKDKKDTRDWSDWESKKFKMAAPKKPSVKAELTGTNKCKFSWSVSDTDESSHYPFNRVVIQTMLVKNFTGDPKNAKWKNATQETSSSASGNKEITENSATLATGNYTRLFRVRSQGCGGSSRWSYTKHVYSTPNKAKQSSGIVKETSSGYDVKVKWDTSVDRSTPVDETDVEWVTTSPLADMSCPTGLTWNDGATVKETNGKEAVHIAVNQTLELDKCLFTRVNTKHDSNINYGTPKLQKKGSLKPPTGLTVENIDIDSQTAKITATNASAVPGTEIEIIFRKNGSSTIVGIIDGNPNYKTVKCPAWTTSDKVSFGVRAILPKSVSSKTKNGVTIYTIKRYMKSSVVWQTGVVSKAPTGLALERDDSDVIATWENNWSDANIIELSWSDNENAWESTEGPETFEIENPFATLWRIAGLENGKIWHVRVRAIFDSGDGRSYSPYSDAEEINLSSSPNVPVLSLSEGVVAAGQGFTASWEYESTDGTPQAEARIYQYLSGVYTLIGRTSTE